MTAPQADGVVVPENQELRSSRELAHPITGALPGSEPNDGGEAHATTWNIWVSGYGQFEFVGTETEAEEMRAHKARWERGNGQKWRADLSRESDKLTAEIVALWSARQGVPMSLLRRRRRARDRELGLSPEAVLAGMSRFWVRSRDLAAKTGFSLPGTREALRDLRKRGLVEVSGPDWRPTRTGGEVSQ